MFVLCAKDTEMYFVCFLVIPAPSMNQAMNLPTQPLATHCLQLSNMFSPQSWVFTFSYLLYYLLSPLLSIIF